MIGVAAWGKGFGVVSSIHIIGGVIAVGVFLLLIAIVGLIGALHHHQVMLFFVSFAPLSAVPTVLPSLSFASLTVAPSTWSSSSSCFFSSLAFPVPVWP